MKHLYFYDKDNEIIVLNSAKHACSKTMLAAKKAAHFLIDKHDTNKILVDARAMNEPATPAEIIEFSRSVNGDVKIAFLESGSNWADVELYSSLLQRDHITTKTFTIYAEALSWLKED